MDYADDDIARAVESAIRHGVSVEEFQKKAAYSWSETLHEKLRLDAIKWGR